uniref:Uncharacterized protein n=1 Tax=Clastoptera arizonana TaxID=38151 RepID=A0A1B6EFH0_9HEMI
MKASDCLPTVAGTENITSLEEIKQGFNMGLLNFTRSLNDFMEMFEDDELSENNRTARSFLNSSLEAFNRIAYAGVDAVNLGAKTIAEAGESAVNTTKAGLETAKLLTTFVKRAVTEVMEQKAADAGDSIQRIGQKGATIITMIANGVSVVVSAIMKAIEAARSIGTREIITGLFRFLTKGSFAK